MPKGPKGEQRPADAIARAVKVAKIATGEIEDELEPKEAGKDPNAAILGSKGGKARARSISPERRSEIAQKAAASRWKKK